MKPSLAASAVLHALVLTWGLWSFSSAKSLEVSYAEALPVEIVMSDVFEGVKGEKKAPVTEKPAPTPTKKPQNLPMPAENTGDNEVDLKTQPADVVKPREVKQSAAAKPQPPAPKPEPEPEPKAAETPPPEPTPAPVPPPEPQPKAAETPPPEPDPVQAAIDAADAMPDPEPAPDPLPVKVPVPKAKPKPPVKMAEAKPETPKPVAKPPEPKKAAQKKDPPPKKTDAAKDGASPSEFNADDIAALLSKEKAAGGGAKRSTEQASLGSRETTGTKLSRSEVGELQGMIQEQMARCWSPPTGVAEAGTLRISIRIRFDPSGELDGPPTIVEGGGGSGVERVASEAALRAIKRCAPFNLPADKYQDGWDVTTLNFDPSQMF